MKKYWIKDLTENQVIHAPTEMIAERLCERFGILGLKWRSRKPYSENLLWCAHREETCYSPSKGALYNRSYSIKEGYEILTIDQLLDFQEYPRVMEVSDNGNSWRKRVVFMEKNGMFLAWEWAETIEEAEHNVGTHAWEYAREIQPATTLELTIYEIAEKFNVSPEQINIKK